MRIRSVKDFRISEKTGRAGFAGCLVAGAIGVACSGGSGKLSSLGPPDPVNGAYSVTLSVTSSSALPKCTAAWYGTVADVATPPSLWSCQVGHWLQIPCTDLLAGAVAYSSASHDLWACSAGQWTAVTLPTGPAGPAGPSGMKGDTGSKGDTGDAGPQGAAGPISLVKATPEPAGSKCTSGGQRIDIGVDTNSNGSLDTGEIQQTVYVCDGSVADGGIASGGTAGIAGAGGASSGAGTGTNGTGGASGSGATIESTSASIIVEPSDGGQAFKTALQGAVTSIYLSAHLLTDQSIINLLVAKRQAGLDVRVLLAGQPDAAAAQANGAAITELVSHGAQAHSQPPTFDTNQQGTAIIDSNAAWILTGDLSAAAWGAREYIAVEPQFVLAELELLFQADWVGQQPGPVTHIVAAPQNARARFLQLISAAFQEIDIEGQAIAEPEVISAITAAAARRVVVKIVLNNEVTGSDFESNPIATLKAGGALVAALSGLAIQANAMVVDNRLAYVGSIDFSAKMLNSRAVGIVVSNLPAVSLIASTVAADFGQGTAL